MENSKNKPLPDALHLPQRVQTTLLRFVKPGDKLCIGLSGGIDSVVLLHLLHQLQNTWQIEAVHVNHQLSPHANEWQAFCVHYCAKLNVPLQTLMVDVERDSSDGLEGAARRARYNAFAKTGAYWIVLAHHQDDQAETMLFNLLRGTGVNGAAGMAYAREFKDETQAMPFSTRFSVLRPLLDIQKVAIQAYAEHHRLSWITDESNDNVLFSRNFLRHEVIPLLKTRFPACQTTLARAAEHFAETSQLLDELAQIDSELATVQEQAYVLKVDALLKLRPARARNLLRYTLRQVGAPMPSQVRLNEMLRQLCTARPDRKVSFTIGGWRVLRVRNTVHILNLQ